MLSGASSRNARAASLAPSIRVGSTSSAPIDSDVSIVKMTVARSRGTRSSRRGPATATTIDAPTARKSTATTWRRQPGRLGATVSSSDVSEKRRA